MANDSQSPDEFPERISDVPLQVVNCYSRLWQLETWLRTMVYVELRALLGDHWADGIDPAPRSLAADKALTHMPTPEMNALSYATLGQLLQLVSNHWDCFACYFPPQTLWEAKLKEVSQIRNRVAHFRVGNANDYDRLILFLRDVDEGFWQFCTSYNAEFPILPPRSNPVSRKFMAFDPLPDVRIGPKQWAVLGKRNTDLPIGVKVSAQRRPWHSARLADGEPGYLYDVQIFAQDGRMFDLGTLLERTQSLHPQIVHIALGNLGETVRLTIPSILGKRQVITILTEFHDAALINVRRAPVLPQGRADAIADAWPEYVIGPRNPLSFLAPDMPCSFFGI
ncbi:hypothetical protein CAF53_01590 [Sphingobium sp. LB126]|uniref:hypothetical protein n=1 Tax=Sphingobium sp. LB126 TaxID=1983755 RepID=UPI000C1FFA97|nr:hypothetical protein [Sphingobium sp. LB126]PJG47069.1 hypothetical protein CAF53_01590 [Sphingobium sp. LB126]